MNKIAQMNTVYKWNGDTAMTIFFDKQVSEELISVIQSLAESLRKTYAENILEVIPAYQSLTICFDCLNTDLETIEQSLKQFVNNYLKEEIEPYKSSLVEIPVCYDECYGSDLIDLAEQCNLSINEVIQLHTQQDYLVNMLGFLPGFLYLSGLNEQLYCPRKSSPSIKIPAGAVGIGGNQTGVYPVDSPGGWHIIGRTPISIFNPLADHPFIAQPLDKIRFVAIDTNEFERISK